jgi:hypothetical protein
MENFARTSERLEEMMERQIGSLKAEMKAAQKNGCQPSRNESHIKQGQKLTMRR